MSRIPSVLCHRLITLRVYKIWVSLVELVLTIMGKIKVTELLVDFALFCLTMTIII